MFFFFYSSAHHPALHSFPTRRSSDLDLPTRWCPTWSPKRPARICIAYSLRFAIGGPQVDHCAGARKIRISPGDRKSTRLNSSHTVISYAVFCLKKKKKKIMNDEPKAK